MEFEKIIEDLKKKLEPSRFLHSIGVMETAVRLSKTFGADEEKARLAGILHDSAKWISPEDGYELCKKNNIVLDEVSLKNYAVVHQYLGAHLAKTEYGIDDEEIISAIRCHATGKENMTKLEKIIYISDMIEPNRKNRPFDGLFELQILCEKDLDKAVYMGLDLSIKHILGRRKLLHPDTVAARNSVLSEILEKNS